ncbi:MAG TPA: sigma-54 dependent transcriptional regulator [Candidatus Polarisedimenticolaceae bacterium]|nr:sigma-54 dependent transcriptional regulator [Candidatus Polarisedimenticolaceae bacterium]
MARERILVVDDEPGVRSMLEAILKDEGYEVTAVGTGEDGTRAAEDGAYDALLLDVWLPGIDGIETLARLRAKGVDAEVVMISGHGTIDTAVKATKAGAFDFVEKPLSLEKTLVVVRNALRQRQLERRNRQLLAQLARDTEILGDSEAARRVRRAADAAAASEAPVLVCGEPGTGRETVARRIHSGSVRSDQALVHVPCGALDAATGGAALFGGGNSPGRLAIAERGSLFLEDVDALPVELQARVASWMSSHPDVRVLASAATDPVDLVEPLRSQVDVLRVVLAPLRERREDIGPLALRFMKELAREYGRPERRLAPDAAAALVGYAWPGNVRALRNVIERLLLLAPGDAVRLEDLPPELTGAAAPAEDLYGPFASLAEGRRAFERYFVRRALREANGDASLAAERAGIEEDELRSNLA